MAKSKIAAAKDLDTVKSPPFETTDLRAKLDEFLNLPYSAPEAGIAKIGQVKWGVYAFFDYDREPIYVGQTNEMLRVRIRRHLTNQRTDAVAMSVLDPFEVYEIAVWPLPQFQSVNGKNKKDAAYIAARTHLNALERHIYDTAIAESAFAAILNEKNPPESAITVEPPEPVRFRIVSDDVFELRSHPDTRIARRAHTISRLAHVISERKVQGGLRRTLRTQAERLFALAERRYAGLGGESSVETEDAAGGEDGDN